MTPERHAQIQQIFEAAVELPTTGRDAYIREACAGDEDLRRRVARLIGADAEPPPSETVKVCPACSRCYDGALALCPADATPLETALHGPLLIDGKYLIERRLGHGGMGAVYQIRHTGLEKTFALKLILADRAVLDWYRKSFETEARALGKLKHPNIVDVTDYGIDPRGGGVPYLVMEYLEGETLRQVLHKRSSIPFPEAAPLLGQVAAAIDFAHARNIVHADLKPGNLFLAGGVIKVVDFGLARFPARQTEPAAAVVDGVSSNDETVTLSGGTLAGTPPYMAPELFRFDAPSNASDRFAFGVIAYEMLTGELAYGNEGCRSARFHDPPAPPSSRGGLPPELDRPVLALLDPIPGNRPATASAAVETMRIAWLAARQREWRRREFPRRLGFSAMTAIGVVLLAALASLTPIGKTLEERTVDARFGFAPAHPPDPRLLVIAIDEAALEQDSRPLAQWSAQMSDTIERLFNAGARSVVLDILLPASWAGSSEFTATVERHADHLALAMESRGASVIGQECIAVPTQYLLGPARFAKLFGFVNLEEDEDRAIRHARVAFPGGSATLAARAMDIPLTASEPFWIDYSAHPQDIPVISWKDVPQTRPGRFHDRIIFVGATYTGSNDAWPVPRTISRLKIPGVVLEAEIANAIASNFPVRGIPTWFCLFFVGLACFYVVSRGLCYPQRFWISLIVTGAVAAGYVLAAFAALTMFGWMAAVVAPELAILLAAGAAWTIKSRLAPYPGKEGDLC